jgi:seryl-tRNA synthetase
MKVNWPLKTDKIFDDMLSNHIHKIKEELIKLNEKQIPELKEIENAVNILENESIALKEELNEVLDAIEDSEDILLQKLYRDADNRLLRREDIKGLFNG